VTRTDRSRRRLLAGLVGAPLAGAAAVTATRLGANAAVLRPGAHGTSASRCAQCGARDHTMLDAACPASPEVV
jgi:4-hydroxy-3-methylbut-2-enyl diphosphate reductase IspH